MKRKERIKQRERRIVARESRELDRALSEAKEVPYTPPAQLALMASSSDAATRLLALMIARQQIQAGDAPKDYFDFAGGLIRDRDHNCSHQAIIVIGESREANPDAVWAVIAEYGNALDYDLRTFLGVALLEEFLKEDFDKYFPLAQDLVRNGRFRFLDTIAICWFDNHGPKWELTQRWIDEARRGRP